MKPPPRTRTQPKRNQKHESSQHQTIQRPWQRTELKKLLCALKRLQRTADGSKDLDYAFLKKHVPTRSISEIQSVVESLKNKVISHASLELKRNKWGQEKGRKPIEVWADMASAVVGTLEEPICSAFSQMLIVSSTEPRTLMNCDPPQVHRPPSLRPADRSIPFRPMPNVPVLGARPRSSTSQPLQVVDAPAAPTGPVPLEPNSTNPPPQAQLPPAASCQAVSEKGLHTPVPSPQAAGPVIRPDTPTAALLTTSAGPHTLLSSSTSSGTPGPGAAPSNVTSSIPAPSGVPAPAAKFNAKFGRTSKHATENSPRVLGLKCIVDFERIYNYLSVIHKSNEECRLTPMESAILLDLLMSLPEELPLLDCNKLHTHLVQVYQCLSSPADSKNAAEMLKNLKDVRTEAPSSQPSTNGTARSSDATDGGGKKRQPDKAESQSTGDNKASSQSGHSDGTAPPLNPFMIPAELLMRK